MTILCEHCGELLVWGDDPEYIGRACKDCGHVQQGYAYTGSIVKDGAK